MRPSKRTEILDAALLVIARSGVTAVTFESVAEEASMTKGGLLYHFPSRDALLHALHEHLAAHWEDNLTEAAGKPAAEATHAERLAAYTQVATRSATREELLLMLETVTEPAMHTPWNDVLTRWTPPIPTTEHLSPTQLNHAIARLAADGLWLHESLTSTPLPPTTRQQIADHLTALTNTPDPDTEDPLGSLNPP